MRQAGRYLEEYRALRARHDFLELCKSPALATEVTLQPVRRFHMDAAILFSDILVLPEALGQRLSYPEGGPRLEPPIRSAEDLARLRALDAPAHLGYVAEAIALIGRQLARERALIGFAGAPYTLATYMVEGATSRHQAQTKALAFREPALLEELLERLAEGVSDFLLLQVEAGVDAVQLFDTWAGDLSPRDFARFALGPARKVIGALGKAGVPVIYYVNGIAAHLEAAATSGASVLGVDWRVCLGEVRRRVGPGVALQGNLDPLVLMAPPSEIRERVRAIHAAHGRGPGHIFNLGHGVLPETPVSGVAAFVDAVRELGNA
jgi:uroporphyrinogen decarboxylase